MLRLLLCETTLCSKSYPCSTLMAWLMATTDAVLQAAIWIEGGSTLTKPCTQRSITQKNLWKPCTRNDNAFYFAICTAIQESLTFSCTVAQALKSQQKLGFCLLFWVKSLVFSNFKPVASGFKKRERPQQEWQCLKNLKLVPRYIL